MQKHFFISYRRSDSAGHAGRLYDHFRNYFGDETIFFDVDAIEPGVAFKEKIKNEIENSDVVLVLIGNQWLEVKDKNGNRRLDDPLDYVRFEIETVLNRDIVVIPVLLQGARMPSDSSLPEALWPLSQRNATTLSDERWLSDIKDLSQRLRKALGISRSKQAELLRRMRYFIMLPGAILAFILATVRPYLFSGNVSPLGPLFDVFYVTVIAFTAIYMTYYLGSARQYLNSVSKAIIMLVIEAIVTAFVGVLFVESYAWFTFLSPVLLLAAFGLYDLIEPND